MAVRTAWVAANNLYAIPVYFVYLVLLLPLRTFDSALYDRIESRFFSWMLAMVACWSNSAGYDIVESGDDLEDLLRHDETFLFMPNHQSTADVPFCMSIFSSYSFCDR
jgi:lysophosphatidylglycerol acyltransferase 1